MLRGPEVQGVTRAQVCEAVRVLGIDPAEVQSLRISKGVVEVVLFVHGPGGNRIAAGNEVATATTRIPVVDDMFDRGEVVEPVYTATVA